MRGAGPAQAAKALDWNCGMGDGMRVVQLSGREMEVVDFYDVGAAERVIEFRCRKCPKPSAFAAIVDRTVVTGRPRCSALPW